MQSTKTQIFDQPAWLTGMGNRASLLRDMIELLFEVSPRKLGNVSHGLEYRDARQVWLAAHTLKGLSEYFDAQRAVAAAVRVEELVVVGRWEDLKVAVTELYSAITELQSEIRPLAAVTSAPLA